MIPIRICLTQDVPVFFFNSTPPLQLELIESPQWCFTLTFHFSQSTHCLNVGGKTGVVPGSGRYSILQELRVHATRAAAKHHHETSLHWKCRGTSWLPMHQGVIHPGCNPSTPYGCGWAQATFPGTRASYSWHLCGNAVEKMLPTLCDHPQLVCYC